MTSERISRILGLAAFLLHAAVSGRYDFFRDELYFIVCGRHPAFGYADQPPLIPLLAAGTQLFGESLVLLRLVPAAAAAALVLVTCALARRAGAGPFGVAVAGTPAAIAPMYLGLTTTLNTGTFEPLAWTIVALLVARAVLDGEPRAWIVAGVVCGLALQAKYAIPLYLVCLGAALVVTGHGRALLRRELAVGVLVAAVLPPPA
jgi:4-amino-4-deoxy-L-arabinose transferase-like glycosyltransferase